MLWNSSIGRRAFLKKTGAATAATAVALHGFRVQVQPAETGGNLGITWALYGYNGEGNLEIIDGNSYDTAEEARAST